MVVRRSLNVAEKSCSSVSDYLNLVFELPDAAGTRCYRGQVNSAWKPEPSVLRDMAADAEPAVISELMLESPEDFAGDTCMFDKLVRAQHYALPTRLLDVSLNPLVGLFFACYDRDPEQLKADGRIFVLDFKEDRVKYADSDAIALICNLARLKDLEKDEIRVCAQDAIAKDAAAEKVNAFLNCSAMQRLFQFVRMEKPYFQPTARPGDLQRYFFVMPKKNNRRIIAQSGAFVAAGLLEFAALERSKAIKTSKITIPAQSKPAILKQLDALNINSRTMFPEIENISQYIKQRWKTSKSWAVIDEIDPLI